MNLAQLAANGVKYGSLAFTAYSLNQGDYKIAGITFGVGVVGDLVDRVMSERRLIKTEYTAEDTQRGTIWSRPTS